MAKQATRQVSIFLNGKQVESTIKNISGAFVEANNRLAKMVVGSDEYLKQLEEVKKYNGLLTEHRQRLKGIEQGWSLTKVGLDKFVGVAAGAFAVDSIIGYGKQLFNTGAQMEAMAKKARTVFGEALPQVTAEAEKNARAMGLTNAQYVAAAANIQDLLVPMGFQRKEAADISTQLVNLSGALSEWTGGQRTATEVSEILNKALLGEREELKSLGISISEADVKAQLAAKGLDKLTGAALEQAKAAATLELILNKSRDAQAQFADESDSAVRRQAELSAKISEIVEKLSTLLLPVFESLVSIASSVVDVFGGITAGIEGVIDPAGAATKAFDEQAKKVSDLETDIVPLLDRYDELAGKATLNAAEQDELQKIITTVAGVMPLAVTEFDKYGKAIGLNTDKVREFIEVEKARLKFVNESAIQQNESLQKQLEAEAQILQQRLNNRKVTETKTSGGGPLGGGITTATERNLTNDELIELQNQAAKLQDRLKGVNAEVARLKGDTLQTPEAPPPTAPGTGGGGGSPDDKALKAAQKLQDDLLKLTERTTELRLDLLAKAKDDELAATIRGIEKRYDAEIAKALELEKKGVEEATAQRIALQALKQEEIGLAVEADIQKAIENAEKIAKAEAEARAKVLKEAFDKDNEERAKYLEEKAEAEAEIKTFAQDALLSERELELAQLEEHYATLLAAAEKFGLDTTALKEAYAKQQADIEKGYADKTAKELYDIQQARLAALQASFTAFGDFVTATLDLLGGEGEKAAAFQKIATLAKIAFDTAAAISSLVAFSESNPANAVTFGAAGVAQFVAGLARILANIGQAKKILSGAPKVQQKAEGSYLDVTGQQDGRTYRARHIPPPATGLLPGYPVLFQSQATGAPVLASERGREYFVASDDLRHPAVANYVRLIDNITHSSGGSHSSVPQFAEGGFTTTATTAPTPAASVDMRLIEQNTAVMQALLTALQKGIIAVVPDGTVLDIQERFGKINKASGGYYG